MNNKDMRLLRKMIIYLFISVRMKQYEKRDTVIARKPFLRYSERLCFQGILKVVRSIYKMEPVSYVFA
jgi:hypothetical protein